MFDAFDETARRSLFFAGWNATRPGVEFDVGLLDAYRDAVAVTQGPPNSTTFTCSSACSRRTARR